MSDNDPKKSIDATFNFTVTRRDFIKGSAGTVACVSLSSMLFGCASSSSATVVAEYPIDSTVVKTSERMISFSYTAPVGLDTKPDPATSPNGKEALKWEQLRQLEDYDELGYGQWEYLNQPLPIVQRTDIMPDGYDAASVTKETKLLNFFAMTDVHLTDKEAPNQFIDLQRSNAEFAGTNSSIYSGVMLYTPQTFDAAIQTANALHKQDPFDFFISLGDVSNTGSYNELRWYIDIIDGKVIVPSSGAHIGDDFIDFQKPFKAAGLDKTIPFYQTLGNHDHFLIGSFPVHENGFAGTFTSDTVWSAPNELLIPNPATFPTLFNINIINNQTYQHYYQGVIDGTSPYGSIIYSGAVQNYSSAPQIVADPDRRFLGRIDWIQEFFNTSTGPKGHGFNLVSSNRNFHLVPDDEKAGFACYSFVPKSDVPLKVIVLDDTQREDDGSYDIHGHGFLDETRWAWLQAELQDGQAADQLMIIACHIPIAVANIGSELEWWLADKDPNATTKNACTITELVEKLQEFPNLLMWIAGHRHFNTIKAFVSPDAEQPEKGFWQVETSSLRDFPQQFRTFEIFINSDYSISIEAVNVDIAAKEGTPAATSRKYAIATQQIIHNDLKPNFKNYQTYYGMDLGPIDPTRPRDGDPVVLDSGDTDPSIQFVDLTDQGIPYNASYNARLFKQLSPAMKAKMEALSRTL